MPRAKQARLSDIFRELCATAAATGRDRGIDLSRGTRLAVRVRNGITTVSLARPRIPIGKSEEITVRVNCQFPTHAERLPDAGQRRLHYRGQTWFQVVFRWRQQ